MENYTTWFDEFYKSIHNSFLQKNPLAYFCIEYALSDLLPTYAGGLGVLAGDYVHELKDRQIPAVAIGLMYHGVYGVYGVIHGKSVKDVVSPEHPEPNLTPLLNADNNPI